MSTPDALDTDALAELVRTDPRRAIEKLTCRPLSVDPQAQLLLGQLLINGAGGTIDAAEAFYLFQLSASAGIAMAMNMAGRCHEYGLGTPENQCKAAAWYRSAAAHDCDWAIYNYAHMLAQGRGVARDRAAAFQWFGRAASMGHARAMHFLGQFHENGWETPASLETAIDWYKRSADAGDFRGQCSYASVLYDAGDIDRARDLLQSAGAKATPAFRDHLIKVLASSDSRAIRELADVAMV
jgi:TPR repeat protein